MTFVVRASLDAAGTVRGTVTRVRTGDAAIFTGIQEGGQALADMLTREVGNPGAEEDACGSSGQGRTRVSAEGTGASRGDEAGPPIDPGRASESERPEPGGMEGIHRKGGRDARSE